MASRISTTVTTVRRMCIVSVSVASAPRTCIEENGARITSTRPSAISRSPARRRRPSSPADLHTPTPNARANRPCAVKSGKTTNLEGAPMADSSLTDCDVKLWYPGSAAPQAGPR